MRSRASVSDFQDLFPSPFARNPRFPSIQRFHVGCARRAVCPSISSTPQVPEPSVLKNKNNPVPSGPQAVWDGAGTLVGYPLGPPTPPQPCVHRYGNTALHWAAEHGHLPSVDALIKAGAKLNIKNNPRHTDEKKDYNTRRWASPVVRPGAVGVGQCRCLCRRCPQGDAAAPGCQEGPRRRNDRADRRRRGRGRRKRRQVGLSAAGAAGRASADAVARRNTPLHCAAAKGHAAATAALINAGVPVNILASSRWASPVVRRVQRMGQCRTPVPPLPAGGRLCTMLPPMATAT